jgi:hypothetical protein
MTQISEALATRLLEFDMQFVPRQDDELLPSDYAIFRGLTKAVASNRLNAAVERGEMTRRKLGCKWLYKFVVK